MDLLVLCLFGIYLASYGDFYSFTPTNMTVNVGFILDSHVPRDLDAGIKVALTISNTSCTQCEMEEEGITINNGTKRIYLSDTIIRTNISDNYRVSQAICTRLKNAHAIVSMATKQSMEVINSIGQTLELPFIVSAGPRSHLLKNSFSIIMTPSYIPAIVDYIIFNEWKIVYYMYDSEDGLWRLEELALLHWTNSGHFRLSYHRISDMDRNVYSELYHMDRKDAASRQKVFILDFGSTATTIRVMKMMIDSGMNRNGYHIIIGSFNIGEYEEFFHDKFLHSGVTITGFKFLRNSHLDETALTNALKKKMNNISRNYTMSTEAALFVDGVALLSSALHSIGNSLKTRRGNITRCKYCNTATDSVCKDQTGPLLLETLKKTKLEGLSGNVAFDERGYRKDYGLKLLKFGFRSQLKEIGNWSSTSGIQLQRQNHTAITDDANRPLIIVTVTEKPFYYKTANGTEEGYIVDLIKLLNQSNVFRRPYIIHTQKNKTYSDMIRKLVADEADLAIAPITITKERQKVVDFTKPFMRTGLSLMIYKPEKRKPGMFSFKEPLHKNVWLCIAVGFLTTSVILFFIGRFSPFEWTQNSEEGPSSEFSMSNSLWSSLGALMQQGSDISPRSFSGRCAESAWWFFTLILVASYTANLAAFLTVESMDFKIRNVDDLVAQTKVKYGTVEGGSSQDFFMNSKVQTYEEMWKVMSGYLMESNEQGYTKVMEDKGEYAFILEGVFNDYLSQQKPCKTMPTGGLINNIDYGIAINRKRRKELGKRLNLEVLKLRELGELLRLETRWWVEKGRCGSGMGQDGGKKRSLTLSNVSGMFHILIGGLIIAMMTSMLEYLIHSRIRKKSYKLKKAKTLLGELGKKLNGKKPTHLVENIYSGEETPLRPNQLPGAQENRGYQTTSPAKLIMLDSYQSDIPSTGTAI
uniref:Glutamate receptor 2-like n=1 Tax=Crassostrea virginica TaxID=6565 RepID=A0A8B8D3L4_CRAVI|nr:glutamate receptor 2-like [Crassostrea virginica]